MERYINYRLNWIGSNWIESNRIESNWIELNWIELNWIELNWIELNWIELNWIELNSTMLQSVLDSSRSSPGFGLTETGEKWFIKMNPHARKLLQNPFTKCTNSVHRCFVLDVPLASLYSSADMNEFKISSSQARLFRNILLLRFFKLIQACSNQTKPKKR